MRTPGDWILTAVWAGLFIVSLPMIDRMMRHFLCSTQWAGQQDFTPERLRLFSFASGKRTLAVLLALVVLVFALEMLMINWLNNRSQQTPIRERQLARQQQPVATLQSNTVSNSNLVQNANAQLSKTVVLTGATNQLLKATNNLRVVQVHNDTTLFPGETLVALSQLPDGGDR